MLWKYLQKFVSQTIPALSEKKDAPWFAIYDDTPTILTYYSNRWPIEVYFQQSKSKLAFGKYQVRSLESIEKYIALDALAYIFFMMDENGFVKFCDGHKSVQADFQKQVFFWIYEQAQNNLPFSDILAALHVV